MVAVLQYVGLAAFLLSLFNLGYILWHNRFRMSAEIITCAIDMDKHFVWLDIVCTNKSGLQFSVVSIDYHLEGRPVKCDLLPVTLPSNVTPYEARRLLVRFPFPHSDFAFYVVPEGDRPSDANSTLTVYTSRGKHLQQVKVRPLPLSALKPST